MNLRGIFVFGTYFFGELVFICDALAVRGDAATRCALDGAG
jgi:hypothetical protein